MRAKHVIKTSLKTSKARNAANLGKAFKYYAQYPGVMQGSEEWKRAKLWGPRTRFGANISHINENSWTAVSYA